MPQSVDHRSPAPARELPTRRFSWAEPVAVAAPALLFLAWLAMVPLHGRRSPGLGWTVGHLAWIAGFAALAAVVVAVQRRLRDQDPRTDRALLQTATGMVLVGLTTSTAQMGIDLIAGWRSATRAEADRLSDSMTSAPGVDLLLSSLGPVLVPVALVVLTALLWRRGLSSGWTPVLTLIGLAALMSNVTVLEPVGLVTLSAGLLMAVSPDGEPDGQLGQVTENPPST